MEFGHRDRQTSPESFALLERFADLDDIELASPKRLGQPVQAGQRQTIRPPGDYNDLAFHPLTYVDRSKTLLGNSMLHSPFRLWICRRGAGTLAAPDTPSFGETFQQQAPGDGPVDQTAGAMLEVRTRLRAEGTGETISGT
jgi:hypothetical protein